MSLHKQKERNVYGPFRRCIHKTFRCRLLVASGIIAELLARKQFQRRIGFRRDRICSLCDLNCFNLRVLAPQLLEGIVRRRSPWQMSKCFDKIHLFLSFENTFCLLRVSYKKSKTHEPHADMSRTQTVPLIRYRIQRNQKERIFHYVSMHFWIFVSNVHVSGSGTSAKFPIE